MPKAPAGAEVGLYVDCQQQLHPGDVVGTPSGRRYLVIQARVQQRGRHVGRQHLRCIVGNGTETPTLIIYWYRRPSKRRS